MRICINGGHAPGGIPDPGAVNNITGLKESDVTDDVAQLVQYYLQQAGYETLVVQENELRDITDASNNWGANLFISVHCNAAGNRSALATETFYGSKQGAKFARYIQSQIINNMGTVNRGIKDGSNLYVIKHTDCPAILVELAFISNDDDEALLASDEKKDEFAKCIARGVTDYVATLK